MTYEPPVILPPEPPPKPEGPDQTSCPFCAEIADRAGVVWQCRNISDHHWPVPDRPPPVMDYETLVKKQALEDALTERGQTSS